MKNEVELLGDGTARIKLTQGQWARVDQCDLLALADYRWNARRAWIRKDGSHTWYAQARFKKQCPKTVYMHRVLVRPGPGLVTDHKNGDGLDNRRANLRACTNGQNSHNACSRGGTSQYKGVQLTNKTCKAKWMTILYFDDEIEAARAYDAHAQKHYGEFARLNFPNE